MKSDQERCLQECLEYFQKRSVYEKLFRKVLEKYKGLGRLGGTFTLTGLKPQEKEDLGGFFQKDYAKHKTVTISMEAMEKALSGSRFQELSWETILTAYFGGKLTSRKEEEEAEERAKETFFQSLLFPLLDGSAKEWLQRLLDSHGDGYSFLLQRYRENPKALRALLENVLKAISELPANKASHELLAIFAARVTGNPHYFDEGSDGEKLLHLYLKEYFSEIVSNRLPDLDSIASRTERKNRLLYEAGILRDDLSNDTLVYGITAVCRDGTLHEGIAGFQKRKEPVKLTLLTLSGLKEVQPTSSKEVYVVENPAVFSWLIQKFPEASILCSNGQPRLATLLLMDLLKENSMFFYAGDFDPEGLLIAQRLKERYKERLHFWNYHVKWYYEAQSEVALDKVRLAKLHHVHHEELQDIKMALLQCQKAGYQENLLGDGKYTPYVIQEG